MKKIWLTSVAFACAALSLLALEVPVLTEAQEEFLRLTPTERRAKFTDKAYRKSIRVAERKIVWREAKEGEASRFRRLPGVPNLRDLGGLTGLDGRRIRTGRVFRSGGFNENAPYTLVTNANGKTERRYYGRGKERLNEASRAFQVENFGIKTDIDLRGDGECLSMTGSPLGPQTVWAHIPIDGYGSFHKGRTPDQMKRIFALFLDEGNYPIAFHCIAGADRTGSLAYLLEALLGVSDADLLLDWELTAFNNPNVGFAHADRYDKLVDGFRKLVPDGTARERAEAYVRKIGFTDEDISKFRHIMLEEN